MPGARRQAEAHLSCPLPDLAFAPAGAALHVAAQAVAERAADLPRASALEAVEPRWRAARAAARRRQADGDAEPPGSGWACARRPLHWQRCPGPRCTQCVSLRLPRRHSSQCCLCHRCLCHRHRGLRRRHQHHHRQPPLAARALTCPNWDRMRRQMPRRAPIMDLPLDLPPLWRLIGLGNRRPRRRRWRRRPYHTAPSLQAVPCRGYKAGGCKVRGCDAGGWGGWGWQVAAVWLAGRRPRRGRIWRGYRRKQHGRCHAGRSGGECDSL